MKRSCYALFILLVVIQITVYAKDYVSSLEYYQHAESEYKQGLYINSLEDCKSALEINPYYKECFVLIGDIYYQTMNYDSSLFYYNKALEIAPYFKEAYLKAGKLYSEREDYDTAVQFFKKVMAFDRRDIKSRLCLIDVYIKTGDYVDAEELYKYIDKISPKNAENEFLKGKLFLKQGNIEESLKIFKYVEMLDPEIPELYIRIGDLYLRRRSFNKAVEAYRKSLKHKESEKYAKTQLASLYILLKEYDKVFDLWDKTSGKYIDLYHIGLSHYLFAIDTLNSGDSQTALSHFEESSYYFRTALVLNADDEISRYMLEKILIRTKKINDDIRKKYSDFHLYKGSHIKNRAGKKRAALVELFASIKLNPQNVETREKLVEIYDDLNFYESLKTELQRILELNPFNLKIKDKLDYVNNNIIYNDRLTDFLNEVKSPKPTKYKLAIKIDAEVYKRIHINVINYYENMITQFLEISNKFNILFIPEHYKNLESIEDYARSLNVDSLIMLKLSETEKGISVNGKIFELTQTKDEPVYSIYKPRRSPNLESYEIISIRKGKLKFLNSINTVCSKIEETFPAIGFVQKVFPHNAIINLGYRQNIKKNDKLKVFNRSAAKEEYLGEITVTDVSEWYSVCDVFDAIVLKAIKTSDVAIYSK